ncbi:MAG: M36 family metallopeptidase [Vicinamibacterales bacterium]
MFAGLGLTGATLVLAQGGAGEEALRYLERHRQTLGLTGSDIRDVVVGSTVVSAHTGVTHVYLQQRYRGIDVWNGILNVTVRADGSAMITGNRFVANIAAAAGGQQPRKAADAAASDAAGHLKLAPTRPFHVLERKGGASEPVTLSDGGIAERPIEARLVWVPTGSAVRLAWDVRIDEVGGEHWWHALVDAETGASLGMIDLIVHDSAEAIALATARADDVAPAALPSFDETDGAAYNVFPIPFESPSDGDRSLVTNAADPSASPFGWHDTDGAPGAEFFVTRGNNVHAYTDLNADNVADPGSDPSGGGVLLFDFPLDLTQNASTYRPAAVTNLFYWNNVMHDVAYGYGFDEAAGNFQVNNYGSGGLGGDDVRAEAQDGSGTNNANFGTPVDGLRPRMQMFIWTHPRPNTVTVNGGPIAGDYEASRAQFGPQLDVIGPVSGTVVLVNDGVAGAPPPGGVPGTVNDGCEPFGGVAGQIALLERGFCTFVLKVANAQAAGAIAVIVANNVAGNPITMGGADPAITIPSVMISLDNATLFRANLPLDATLRPDPVRSTTRDSDLDAGVIAHEYGHGISNRLTGGPATVACLNNAEQMGEGWSDWFALTLTTHPSDTATTRRGVGSYLIFEPPDGDGIRPTSYTTDMTVNPSTYASVANTAAISQPHGIGYVWNTMLWEVYWNLVDRYGYNANVYDDWTTGGNNLALQLVMDGMKFQPCRPGFVDGRNAILQADEVLTGGANACEIWRGFAKRGLGVSANQGSSANRLDGVEAFDLPGSCTAATFGGFHPPVDGPPSINTVNAGSVVPVKFTLEGATTLPALDSQPVDCTTLAPTGEAPAPLESPGATGLSQKGDKYHVNWKTDAAWAGSCRRVTLRVPAASNPVAYFRFE